MKEILYTLFEHRPLDRDQARALLVSMARGEVNDSQMAALMTVYLMRSITVDELAGFRDALSEMRVAVDLADYDPIDIVGTGGDGKNTFNISTAACFVVAGAGFPVVKHGNYGASSVSGASNVLEYHGVKFSSDVSLMRRSLDACGMAYLHAPLFSPALKAVAGVRRELGVRTFFNMLGPLANPVMPRRQMLGVFDLKLARMYYYLYQQLRGTSGGCFSSTKQIGAAVDRHNDGVQRREIHGVPAGEVVGASGGEIAQAAGFHTPGTGNGLEISSVGGFSGSFDYGCGSGNGSGNGPGSGNISGDGTDKGHEHGPGNGSGSDSGNSSGNGSGPRNGMGSGPDAGVEFAVVTSLDGYDEISLTADFKIFTPHGECVYSPEELGFVRIDPEDLSGGESVAEAAKIFDAVIAGDGAVRAPGRASGRASEGVPVRASGDVGRASDRASGDMGRAAATATARIDCVVANAAFAIRTAAPKMAVNEAIMLARESIESGRAMAAFKKFVEINS